MINVFSQAIRVNNIIIGIICCLVGFIKIDSNDYISMSLSLVIIILLMMASNLMNDIYDIKIDKINKPNRPLIKYPRLKSKFQFTVFAASLMACMLSLYLNNTSFLIIVISIPVLLLYTPLLKGIPLLGNIVVSFYLALVFIFIEVALLNTVSIMILPASIAFGVSLIREIIKDAEDYKGDQLEGVLTLPIYMGIKKTIYFACFLMFCFLMFCGLLIGYLNNFYYTITVFFLVFMPIFYLIFFLIKSPTSEACSKASKLLKIIIILGLIIIYII